MLMRSCADRAGNDGATTRRLGVVPIMAMGAKLTIVQAQHMVELGDIPPEQVITPGLFVDRVVHVPYGDPPKA